MFRAQFAHHQEVKLCYTASGIVKLCRCDDTRCCIIQFWPPDDENILLETCRHIMNLLFKKTRICALSWLITKIILKCAVSKTSKIPTLNYSIFSVNKIFIFYSLSQKPEISAKISMASSATFSVQTDPTFWRQHFSTQPVYFSLLLNPHQPCHWFYIVVGIVNKLRDGGPRNIEFCKSYSLGISPLSRHSTPHSV